VGLVAGLALSVGAGRLLTAAFPTGDDRQDFAALLMVIPLVVAVTFLAAYIPARRASRTSPMLALRQE
jgi:ABC-type lipoprotein release transport system permease subunit